MNVPTNKLYVVLIILLGLAAGYLYYSQWAVPAQAAIPPPPVAAQDDLAAFKNLTIDFAIFNDPTYANLSVFGEAPVKPGITGKKDIFAP